jgi:hypothetical protein
MKSKKKVKLKLWKKRRMLITDAKQIPKPSFATGKASNLLAGLGLRYEKKLRLELEKLKDFTVYHNPWFLFNSTEYCSPDFVLWPNEEELPLIVIECKLKYVKDGTDKLHNLYLPVVRKALKTDFDPIGIVIAKSLTPEVKSTITCLSEAKENKNNMMLWLLNGRITW